MKASVPLSVSIPVYLSIEISKEVESSGLTKSKLVAKAIRYYLDNVCNNGENLNETKEEE